MVGRILIGKDDIHKNLYPRTLPGGPVAKTASSAADLGSNLGRRTRSSRHS